MVSPGSRLTFLDPIEYPVSVIGRIRMVRSKGALLLLLPLSAYAGTIYSTGFESPDTIGGISGQDGYTTSCTAGTPISEGQFLSFFDALATINSNDLGAIDNLSLSIVPKPATYGLTAVALLACALLLRRQAAR